MREISNKIDLQILCYNRIFSKKAHTTNEILKKTNNIKK